MHSCRSSGARRQHGRAHNCEERGGNAAWRSSGVGCWRHRLQAYREMSRCLVHFGSCCSRLLVWSCLRPSLLCAHHSPGLNQMVLDSALLHWTARPSGRFPVCSHSVVRQSAAHASFLPMHTAALQSGVHPDDAFPKSSRGTDAARPCAEFRRVERRIGVAKISLCWQAEASRRLVSSAHSSLESDDSRRRCALLDSESTWWLCRMRVVDRASGSCTRMSAA